MRNRKEVILMAVASVLATSSLAMADAAPKTSLSLNPTVVTADTAAPDGLLMMGLDKAGVAKILKDAKLNIYGWIEGGYTYNHRHGGSGQNDATIFPGPFNTERGNRFMMNQLVLRFEKQVDGKTFDVGGMVELMYGSDANRIHATGLGYNGSDATDNNSPADSDAVANIDPTWQFDIPQAYVDIGVPIGTGLRVRVGKFVTLLSYETIDPRTNPFYSHSYLFNAVPFTHVGIMGDYKVNDNLEVQLGITRGWDIGTEDTNGCAIDVLGQIAYKFNNQLNAVFNFSVGPENGLKNGSSGSYSDSGHYRVALDPIVYWQVTKALKVAVEGLYVYDGGRDGTVSDTHHYGDVWGAAGYVAYTVNDMLTVNGRLEKEHYNVNFGGPGVSGNVYEATLGVTITPLPKDQYLKGLSVRPEIRYDFTDSSNSPFQAHGGESYKDQLTFGADVIFQF
jgi:hypothetical protein